MSEIKLCVNVDHIATVREARGGIDPDPIEGARVCEENGASGITVHLREDRRHIQDLDIIGLRDVVTGKYNLEMALSDEIITIAKNMLPDQVTLVPEKREELTTEGGLDVARNFDKIKHVTKEFQEKGIIISLFIEPDLKTVELSKKAGAEYIELHTGTYCDARDETLRNDELHRIYEAARLGEEIGIGINAGHGLNLDNLGPILDTPALEELNIGHSIIARSIFVGLPEAVREMLALIKTHTSE